MTLHHRIWEMVAMIGQSRGQETAISTEINHETVLQPRAARPSQPSNVENNESEITRLTWAVIDGKANAAERQRLAELVSAQHDRRLD